MSDGGSPEEAAMLCQRIPGYVGLAIKWLTRIVFFDNIYRTRVVLRSVGVVLRSVGVVVILRTAAGMGVQGT